MRERRLEVVGRQAGRGRQKKPWEVEWHGSIGAAAGRGGLACPPPHTFFKVAQVAPVTTALLVDPFRMCLFYASAVRQSTNGSRRATF